MWHQGDVYPELSELKLIHFIWEQLQHTQGWRYIRIIDKGATKATERSLISFTSEVTLFMNTYCISYVICFEVIYA